MGSPLRHRLEGGVFIVFCIVTVKLIRKASRALSESVREAMAELANDTPGLDRCVHCSNPIVSGFSFREVYYHRQCLKDAVSTGALSQDEAEKAEAFTARKHPLNRIASEALTAGLRDSVLSTKADVKQTVNLHIIPDKP